MKRLRERQVVALGLGPVRIECRVVAINHGEAALAPVALGTKASLPGISGGATLTFEHDRGMVMLRGTVRCVQGVGDLRFIVNDGVQVRQPRSSSRLRVELPVLLTPLDPDGRPRGETVEVRTVDVSLSGLGVRTAGVGERGEHVLVELELPGGPLQGAARIMRRTPWVTAVEFGPLLKPARERLRAFLLDHQRRQALAV